MKAVVDVLTTLRSGEGLKGQLLRGGVGSIMVKVGSTLLNIILAIVLARALGAEGYGIYSFVFALITIMAIPAQMGLPNLVMRETAKAQAAGQWSLMKGLWRWSTLMALIMSLILMALGGVATWLIGGSLPEGALAVFYWGLVLVPLVALGNLRGAALRGLRHVVQGQLPEFILRPVFLITLLLSMHFALSSQMLAAPDAMMLHAVASLISFAVGAWLLLRARPAELQAETLSISQPRLWLRSALPLGMVEGMQLINGNVGIILLGSFASAQDVGIFRVALQGATIVAFGLQSMNMLVGPHFARLHSEGQRKRLQRLAKLSARVSLLIAIVAAAVLVLAGRQIIDTFFGHEFGPAYWPLIALLVGQVFNAFAGSVGLLLNMAGYEAYVARALLVSTALNVAVSAMLVPTLGAVGAACGAAASLIVWNAMLIWCAYRRLGIKVHSI